MLLSHEVTGEVRDGVMWPSFMSLYPVMSMQSEINGKMLEMVRELAGAAMVTLPSSVGDFDNPEMMRDIERFMASGTADARTRVAVMRMLWDFIGTEFGFYAAYGILGALYRRETSGLGARIETNMLDATIAFAPDAFVSHKRTGARPGPFTRVSMSQSFALRGSDRPFAIHLSSQQKFWDAILNAIDRTDLRIHPDYLARELRIENYHALRDELMRTTEARPDQ